MTLQRKILFHLCLVFAVFTLMILFYVRMEHQRLKELWQTEKNSHQEVLKKLISLKGESLYTLSYDYTYWDEMVEFVLNYDESWATANLEASLETYKANVVLVYNLNGSPVYYTNNQDVVGDVFQSAMPNNIPALFAASPFRHFFVRTEAGLLELRGAAIHKTDDQNRENECFGYFFAGRLWDKSFLDELSLLTGAEITLAEGPQKTPETSSIKTILLTHDLPGLDKQVVGELIAVAESLTVQSSIRNSKQVLFLFIAFSILLSILIMTFLFRWVSRPLRQIALTLEKEDLSGIKNLLDNKTEFGRLAKLIQQFFIQKETLLNEIAERKKAEHQLGETQFQLLQSEKMASIGHLAAGVAHEINNPVGYISSNLESLEEYVKIYDAIIQYIPDLKAALEAGNTNRVADTILKMETAAKNIDLEFIRTDLNNLLGETKKGTERIKSIVSDLKSFARTDDKEKKLTCVEDIVDGVLGIVQNEIKYKADLVKEYSKTPAIHCHPQHLGQVFINLLVNAAQAIEKHGTITIKTSSDQEYIYVSFADTGAGIAQENLNRIFNPFFTTKPVGKGTGLGLSISFDIIQKIGGQIKVSSEVGKGTTFTVMIPADRGLDKRN
ncbi:MAG: ATP-binding protein [Candidatus Omnitrophota bacterium]